jgi:hypothetical protein
MQLVALDPTYRNNNSLGKYGKWILNLYNRGNLSEGEFSEVTALLNQFTIYRNRIQNKDLNAYKTLDELSDILAQVVDDDSMLSDRQKLRFKKNLKAGRVSTGAEDDYDIVLDTPKYTVYVPNTHEASMKLGKGTDWCTAHENPDWYNSYTENGGKLYIIKDKSAGKRWQYSDKNGDFLDEYDILMNSYKMFNSLENYETFFNDILEYDESDYNEEGFLYVDHNKFLDRYDLEWYGMNLATILINGEYYAHYEHNEGDGVLRYTKSKKEFEKMLNETIDNYWQNVLEAFRQENEDEKEFRES